MSLQVRCYRPEDYEIVAEWWRQWNWPVIPQDTLPAIGIVVERDGPICAAWIYQTDSDLCWAEWFISDKTYKENDRSAALDLLIKSLVEKAKSLGFRNMFSSVRNPALIARLKKHGYGHEEQMTNLTRPLWG